MKQKTSFFIFVLFLAIFSYPVFSQQLSGIRVESDSPVEVFINGDKACNPVQSCMVTNLRRGYYLVEVYAISSDSRYAVSPELLFSERVYFSGRGLKDIFVDASGYLGHARHPEDVSYPMDDGMFNELMEKVKSASFDSDKKSVIEMAASNALFSTRQVEQLAGLFAFDSEKLWLMKKIYPSVVDRERAFVLLDLLTFSRSKDEFKAFIAEQD